MLNEFERILDDCIDRINNGESIQSCMSRYPQYSEQLEPLLKASLRTKSVYSSAPSTRKILARQRFIERMEQRQNEKKSLLRILVRPLVWAPLAALIVLLAIYFGIKPVVFPEEIIISSPNPNGNFAFLISDDVNAIGDFENVTITISEVGLFNSDNSGQWVKFTPEIREVDLTQVQGEKTREIWRGDVPEGKYSKVFIYVTDVRGTLKTGETVEIKLPSSKLHISKSFEVVNNALTSFTYDVTVIATGNTQSGIKYILKPQADQSGADQTQGGDKNRDNNDEPGGETEPTNPVDLPATNGKPLKEE
jgi:hypothetical protein